MKNKFKKINFRFVLAFITIVLVFNFFPLFLLAQTATSGLVTCGKGAAGPNDCQWEDLVQLFKNVVNFIYADILIPLAVVAIVYAGIQILLNRENPAQLGKAWGTLRNVGIGIFLALGAYAIIRTITLMLAGEHSTFRQAVEGVFNGF
ncbi:MAG: TrbC/VirB2 family protein [Candidatus Paceibacterota bacterium]|jgi:type IV secretory pathway VirB2 component (pilin)